MSQLSNLINDALDRKGISGLSSRDLAGLTDGAMSKDSVIRYRRGDHGVPSETALQGLAALTGLSVESLRQAAVAEVGGHWDPPTEAVRLSRRQRAALEELIRAMVASEDRSDEPEWLLAHPDRDQVLQRQLADVRGVRAISDTQRDELETTIRLQRRSTLINMLRNEDDDTHTEV